MSAQPEISPSVVAALGQLEAEYEEVLVEPDGGGGAYITVRPVVFGARWNPETEAVEFAAAYNYPYTPIYPFYSVANLRRADGQPQPNALQQVNWRGREVTQISLRTRRWEPAHDTASTALRMVAHWFQTAP
jgi:hypothetical protein